jgi:hypothetical protein
MIAFSFSNFLGVVLQNLRLRMRRFLGKEEEEEKCAVDDYENIFSHSARHIAH